MTMMTNTCSLMIQANVGPKKAPGKAFSRRPPTNRSTSDTFLIGKVIILTGSGDEYEDNHQSKDKGDENILMVIMILRAGSFYCMDLSTD